MHMWGDFMSENDGIHWPEKAQEMDHPIMDSTRWDDFPFRDDDIVIATWAKSGTTWLQQIVGQLIFEGAEGVGVGDIAPWLDMTLIPKEGIFSALDAQTHRRFIKTHLPANSLVIAPKAKYLYVARDGRDAIWSAYNHHANLTEELIELADALPGAEDYQWGPRPDDIRQYFHQLLDRDSNPWWPFWPHIQSWWEIRELPNVLLLHFNNLKADLPGEMRRIASFLDIEVDESLWPMQVEHCTFEYMKEHAPVVVATLGELFVGGGKTFIHKGTNGRWRDTLTSAELEKYEKIASENLTADCARWLATGETPN